MASQRQKNILNVIQNRGFASISEIISDIPDEISIASLNRDLSALLEKQLIVRAGRARATKYSISPAYKLFFPINVDEYFEKEIDNRRAQTHFNFDIFDVLESTSLFNEGEFELFDLLQKKYQENISQYTPTLYQKELERLTIELSWKSSQIEGNTYSLLETERLFLEKELSPGKPKEDAVMLLNHKKALTFILKNFSKEISRGFVETVHDMIIKDLGVSSNLRTRPVGVVGTAYIPLDNVHQIEEAIEKTCALINRKEKGIEKAFLALLLLSYIQPFEDGNKRTARMISTALLLAFDMCPLSYRSIDPITYKKSMLLFYEQNNIQLFKKIFTDQATFAVKTYFP
ncbi:MAG: cell filamentation protein Fic [Rickettsiales bacterium]|nr:cell filamentation protein Fic [Rickettsiales bacterium]|tara:strand:+ start:370 stop:1404 length:1035 start_codon:yes stop_codon:yes gene_type:complete